MSQDESEGNRFGHVREMPNHDQTSASPDLEVDYSKGRLQNTRERFDGAKKKAYGGSAVLASAATEGIAGDKLREMGVHPTQYAGEAVDFAKEYLNDVSGEVAGYMADPQNVERAAEASKFVNEIVTNLG
jgi:hypothetical protein